MADPNGNGIDGGTNPSPVAPPASPPAAVQTSGNVKHPHFLVLQRTRSPSVPVYPSRQPDTSAGSSTSVNQIAAKVSVAVPTSTVAATTPAPQPSSRSKPPQFAEQFSSPLRRRHRHAAATADFPLISPGDVHSRTNIPHQSGAHGESYEGSTEPSLYRGLPRTPGVPNLPPAAVFRSYHRGRQMDEEAISLRSSKSSRRTKRSRRDSSSSSSSGNSFVSLGRRAVVGALEAVGRGLGMLSSESDTSSIRSRRRRRSTGQRSTGLTDDEKNATGSTSQQAQGTRRRRRSLIQPRKIRAWSFGSFLGSSSSSSASTFSGAGGRASTLSITSIQRIPRKKRKRMKRRKSMATASSSCGSSASNSSGEEESDHEPPGRRIVPGKKEFSLLFPFELEEALPAPNFLSPSTPSDGLSPPTLPSSAFTSSVHLQQSTDKVTSSPRLEKTTVLSELLTILQTIRGTPPSALPSSNTHVSDSPPTMDSSSHTFPNPPIPSPCPTPPLSTASISSVPQRLTPAQILNVSPTSSPPLSPHVGTRAALESRLHPHPLSMAPVNSSTSEKKLDACEVDVKTDGQDKKPGQETQKNGSESTKPKGPWWLDVHCPDWEDMRIIGETLNLHPLTLEDILHQDPREKLEVFSRLDYYLLAIRSIDEAYFKWTDSSSPLVASSSGQSVDGPADTHDPSVTGLQDVPVDPTLAGTNPDLPFQEKPVLVTADGRFVRPDQKTSVRESKDWGLREAGKKRRGKSVGKVEIVEDRPGKEGLEGVGVGAKNIYLVVLKDGIVSFHFEDVSKHILSVRQQILSSRVRNTLSSDWIAHGVMDSVVDTFFPLIDFVEEEADAIDSEIIMHDALSEFPLRKLAAEAEAKAAAIIEQEKQDMKEQVKPSASTGFFSGTWTSWRRKDEVQPEIPKTTATTTLSKNEFEMNPIPTSKSIPTTSPSLSNSSSTSTPISTNKEAFVSPIGRKPTFTWPSTTVFSSPISKRLIPARMIPRRTALFLYTLLARVLLFLSLHPAQQQARKANKRFKMYKLEENSDVDRGEMLKRMVNMRRLTTGLTRLLGPKREVVGRLRKRVEELGKEGWGGGSGREMGIYFGDIQDHIIELQSTLLHYEYLLSQAQPAYLAQLQVKLSMTRARSDQAILRLSYVAVGILPIQFITSALGFNVNVPFKRDHYFPGNGHLEIFFAVMVILLIVVALFACLVMYFKRLANHSRRFGGG